jgi:amidase
LSEQFDPFAPAVDLAAAIRRKDVSPVEVADACLERIDELDPGLNAFCRRDDDRVREAARRAATAVARARSTDALPPFLGVPLAVKDLYDVAGWPTSHGSAGADTRAATTSDPVVERLLDAGFVTLGKTTTSEFGTLPFTESDALGTARNPWNRAHTPGGSSSGSGIAVSAGMAPIALAGDGGGSIRVPASCNGLVGLKPTRGRVTNRIVEAEGLGTAGVVTRTVADTAAALDVLARHDPGAWWSPPDPSFARSVSLPPPTGIRIGVLVDAPVDGVQVDPACTAAVDTAVRVLEAHGHAIVDAPLPLPPADELITAFTVIWNVVGAGVDLADPDRIEPHNRALRRAAQSINLWDYVERVQASQHLSRRIVEAFVARYDVLVTPTMACLPPLIGAWRAGTDDDPLMALVNSYPMAVFTSVFNVTGQPAISVPVAHDDATGLPVGVQLVAAPWREDLLLQLARSLEVAIPWSARRPPVP